MSNFFDVTNIGVIISVVVLLTFSAFFSASEIAFSSSSNVRIKKLAEQNKKGARKALYIYEHFDNALSTILVGNNFVNILSTTLCAFLFTNIIVNPVVYNIVNTVVMTIVILIFGEILPKAIAKSNPEGMALKLAPMLFVVMKVLFVICAPFNWLQKAIKSKKPTDKKPTVTEDELETIVETMEDEGVIDEQNAEIIFGALKFNDVSVKDIMTPRVDMVCVNIDSKIEEVKKIFLTYQYSRLPVYKKSKDNIVGIINQKDFFSAIIGNDKVNIESLIAPALFVSKNTKINNAMKLMQREKKHMAIVSDEYGGTSGVITMEDCFEEVFGEVYDEHDDSVVNTISQVSENKYKVNAELSVEELFDYLQIEKMPKNKYSTIATFLCDLSKKVPQQSSVITFETVDEVIDENSNFIKKPIKLAFALTKVEKRRIKEVELTITYQEDAKN